jgi:hypothetical protein
MIQRIQSVYLFLVLLLSIAILFVPLAEYSIKEIPPNSIQFTLLGFHSQTSNTLVLPALIVDIAIGLIALITIFQYNKRKIQIKLCLLNVFLTLALVALIFYYAFNFNGYYIKNQEYLFGICLPTLMILFLLLARRAIKKDDELVRAADRLR